MNNIEELKRFIYSATVTSGSGSQSFYIDAKNREEADARAANNESDGMYADDSEVTDLDALDYEDETTVDDFGDFPIISREQLLIAQLEAAQKEVHGLKMKLSDAGCLLVEWKQRVEKAEKERDDLLNQEFQQRLANAEHQLYMKDLAIHNIKASRVAQFRKRLAAEAALSAANEKLSKPVVLSSSTVMSRAYVVQAIKAAGFTVEGNADEK
ncbi:TPA: hypothetical protein ACYTJQ_000555 [Yersinia enterocolitica]|uniref:hypothetical protein n=1 Tax=Yersinia enterocolitica TaxID=630 RepID=UPI0028DFCE08|nr:hypothetical protein [Yersinia enterocolitica]HEC1638630.1 hypothetical protein [Yersinia enterocolitica]